MKEEGGGERSLLARLIATYERSEDNFHFSADSSGCESLKMSQFSQIQNHVTLHVSRSAKCITWTCSTVHMM